MDEISEHFFDIDRQVRLTIQKLQSKHATHTCLYPGCKEHAILSHSISRNTLELIAENGHLYCPFSNMPDIGKNYQEAVTSPHINIKFQKTGIYNAGTFKGFCNPHDFVFFENLDKHTFLTQRDLFLQLYRTTCKFYFNNATTTEGEKRILNYEFNSNTTFENSLDISLNYLLYYLYDMLIDFQELDKQISISFDETLLLNPYNKNFNTNFSIIYKAIPNYYNFALENDLIIKFNGYIHHCIIALVPGKINSNLIILCHNSIINTILSKINNEISLLNFLESIFILDSKFYLPPSIVDNWNDKKKKIITEDYFFVTERKPFAEYDISVFDAIRRKIIDNITDKEILEKENNKLSQLPNRPNILQRFHNQGKQISKQRTYKIEYIQKNDY